MELTITWVVVWLCVTEPDIVFASLGFLSFQQLVLYRTFYISIGHCASLR